MTPFVWIRMTDDAGEPLGHIITRKEAERKTGGQFWWGVGTALCRGWKSVVMASGGTLPVLFSASGEIERPKAPPAVRVWNGWQNIYGGRHGRIPAQVLVLSVYAVQGRHLLNMPAFAVPMLSWPLAITVISTQRGASHWAIVLQQDNRDRQPC